jgi:hypothetical protein
VVQGEKYPLLQYILTVLSETRPVEEIALAYLSKILTPFFYQRSDQVLMIVM